MSETLHQERQANTALEPTAAPLLGSSFAGIRTHAVGSTVLPGSCGSALFRLGPVPKLRKTLSH
jgi:hypothetical protein